MPRHVLVALLLAASSAPGAAPPLPGPTEEPRFEYVCVGRVNFLAASSPRPLRGDWSPSVFGVSAAGEGALADWSAGGPLTWDRLLLPPGWFTDDDVADLERCYRQRGFLDVRVSAERSGPYHHPT